MTNTCDICNRPIQIDNLKGKPAGARGYCLGFEYCHQRTEPGPYKCAECGNDQFQEVGSVTTTTRVLIDAGPNGPVFQDYSDHGSEPIWDSSEGHYIECRHCLTAIEAEGFEARLSDEDAMARITAYLNDEPEWNGGDVCEVVAYVVRLTGRKIEEV